jgi:hypothetical protein
LFTQFKSLHEITPNYLQLLDYGIFVTAVVAEVSPFAALAEEEAEDASTGTAAAENSAASMATAAATAAAATVSHSLFHQQNNIDQSALCS